MLNRLNYNACNVINKPEYKYMLNNASKENQMSGEERIIEIYFE